MTSQPTRIAVNHLNSQRFYHKTDYIGCVLHVCTRGQGRGSNCALG